MRAARAVCDLANHWLFRGDEDATIMPNEAQIPTSDLLVDTHLHMQPSSSLELGVGSPSYPVTWMDLATISWFLDGVDAPGLSR